LEDALLDVWYGETAFIVPFCVAFRGDFSYISFIWGKDVE